MFIGREIQLPGQGRYKLALWREKGGWTSGLTFPALGLGLGLGGQGE